MTGLEPATSWSQTTRSTKLSYTPGTAVVLRVATTPKINKYLGKRLKRAMLLYYHVKLSKSILTHNLDNEVTRFLLAFSLLCAKHPLQAIQNRASTPRALFCSRFCHLQGSRKHGAEGIPPMPWPCIICEIFARSACDAPCQTPVCLP